MRIFLLALACLIIGMIIGNRMTHDGDIPGCPTPTTSRSAP